MPPIDPAELEFTLNKMLSLEGLAPGFTQAFRQLMYRSTGTIVIGRIVDHVPHVGCYAVSAGERSNIPAVPISVGSSLSAVSGGVDASCYNPGTYVLLFYPEQGGIAYILGAVPMPVDQGDTVVPDSLVQSPRTGVADDDIYQWALAKKYSWGIQNFSSSRPTDQLAGDWGAINELGLAVILSKFMALLRVSDDCGIWAFYMDRLLRLSGYNLEQFTSSTEQRIFNDEGEVHDVLFGVKYPWEALGLISYGTEAFKEAAGAWETGNKDSYFEPQQPDQTGLWRTLCMRGYLGDLKRESVAVPPTLLAPETYGRRGEPYSTGVLEITEGADGRYAVRSAKEILFVKYALIPAPKQLAPPDDSASGDKIENYKASGILGADGAPEPKPQDEFNWGPDLGDARSGLFLEYLAYTFNWYKVQGIANHTKDWELPEESKLSVGDLPPTISSALYEADGKGLSALEDNFWAELPKHALLKIDHRTEAVKYYQSASAIAMLDDGSVMIEDGYGSQLLLSRGNVKITAPGDVMLAPGRNVVSWAPGDFIARAGRSVDVTATKHDVRIKAERNMHVLGGNSSTEQGGVLIESRSTQRSFNYEDVGENVVSSGIVLKTPTDVAIWAGKDLVLGLRALGSTPGRIVFDANEGLADIYMRANKAIRELSLAADQFGDLSNVYEQSGSRFETQVSVKGQVVIVDNPDTGQNGNLIAAGTVAAIGSVLTGSGIPGIVPDGYNRGWEGALLEHGGVVIPQEDDGSQMLVGKTPDFYEDLVTSLKQAIDSRTAQVDADRDVIEQEVYANEDGLGNSALINKVGFTLRSDEQYAVGAGFKLHQARWQQLYRKLGITLVWAESPVKAPGDGIETYPHPGKTAWKDEKNLLVDKDQYFDTAAGRSKDRDDFTPAAVPAAPTEMSLDQGYLVTRELD